jgi:hypothetical protein
MVEVPGVAREVGFGLRGEGVFGEFVVLGVESETEEAHLVLDLLDRFAMALRRVGLVGREGSVADFPLGEEAHVTYPGRDATFGRDERDVKK